MVEAGERLSVGRLKVFGPMKFSNKLKFLKQNFSL
jgi:hypothetical protein